MQSKSKLYGARPDAKKTAITEINSLKTEWPSETHVTSQRPHV